MVFDYGLSDTQDGLRRLRNGIYILWLTFSLCDKNSGERLVPIGSLDFLKCPHHDDISLRGGALYYV